MEALPKSPVPSYFFTTFTASRVVTDCGSGTPSAFYLDHVGFGVAIRYELVAYS